MSLYRKYRPASFAEVVGQEQVTKPLSAALDSGRINHAYLFSGPRGCGKTSSARILARSLNCVEGPTSTPCGHCDSCRALAPDGPGTLDVTELDAASHGGVDDIRELRDRAYYAPAESRYRVFIIDECHMISREGSNALLKVVEEPPEHVVFIFATTEPEKVIGTIRSRTHHYPFRLLTPQAMRGLLERTVAAEGVRVEDTVYPLVIQAGGGSPRDSLSIMDQLIGGSGDGVVTYEKALPLLGVTDFALIDATVEALADSDGAGLFATTDRVIETGIEPRRFVLDLLDRLRDLMVIQAVPEAFDMGLVSAPAGRAEVLRAEAGLFGPSKIAQLADQVNERLPEMRGATSPRLLLEILLAHLMLTATGGAGGAGGADGAALAAEGAPQATGAQAAREALERARAASTSRAQGPERQSSEAQGGERPEGERPTSDAAGAGAGAAQPAGPAGSAGQTNSAGHNPWEQPSNYAGHNSQLPEQQEPAPEAEPAPEPAGLSDEQIEHQIREDWASLRQKVGEKNRVARIMLAEARVLGVSDGVVTLGHHTGALAERLNAESNNSTIVEVLSEALGQPVEVRCEVGTSPKGPAPSAQAPVREPTTPAAAAPIHNAARSEPRRQPQRPETQRPEPQAQHPEPQHHNAPRVPTREAGVTHSSVPLPPEPEDDVAPPPPDPQDAQAEEEEMMREAAQTPGHLDRRDALSVARDLLARELGAQRM